MTAPHDKLAGFRTGDRAKLSVEFVIDGPFAPNPSGITWFGFSQEEIASDTFQIERIEPPFQVGEMVTWGTRVENWKLVAIEGETGILWNGMYPGNAKLSDLERIA